MLEEAAKADDQGKLLNVMETVRLCCRVFFSLNWQDIPEFFEDNMDRWFPPFATLLAFNHRLLLDNAEEERPGPLELVRAAVVRACLSACVLVQHTIDRSRTPLRRGGSICASHPPLLTQRRHTVSCAWRRWRT